MADTEHPLRLGVLAIGINLSLMIVKIAVGMIGNSYALIADGIESASDIFTSIVTWAGFRWSLRPADAVHPYGYGKIDSLTGVFSGLCLLAAAGLIAWQAILEIRTPHHAPAWFTLPVLLGVVAVKELLSRRVFAVGHSLDSNALKGDAWHHRSDAITSAAAAVGIAIALVGGKGYEMADDWGALIACTVIVANGVRILTTSFSDTLDRTVSPEVRHAMVEIGAAVPGVKRIEKCLVRKSGIDLFVELHVEVEPLTTIRDGHEIAHQVKAALMAANRRIKDVTVHLEPAADGT
jgi:cation diffusion facilitator family transporter